MAADMAARIKGHENRIERLESLEHANAAFLPGQCLYFEEYKRATGLATSIKLTPKYETLREDFCNSHIWLKWRFRTAEASACVPFLLQYSPWGLASYEYAYAYTKGGAMTNVAAGAANGVVIGRIPGSLVNSSYYGTGFLKIIAPQYGDYHGLCSEWEMYDSTQSAGSRQESGHASGTWNWTTGMVWSLTLCVASGSRIDGYAWLYSVCPEWYCGEGPPD
jgi:hypothetical protein